MLKLSPPLSFRDRTAEPGIHNRSSRLDEHNGSRTSSFELSAFMGSGLGLRPPGNDGDDSPAQR